MYILLILKGIQMKIPCAFIPTFITIGLAFLKPTVTNIQFQNFTLIATALVLGAKFSLTEISLMWLKEKSVSTLSEFLSDAKISTIEMDRLYLFQMRNTYKVSAGYFLIDDTMKHHTNFCKWIYGVQILFDHALKTNLKAICIVFLYYTDGALIKFPICHRIFLQKESTMPWRKRREIVHKSKNELAIEMIEWAVNNGFPKCLVLADSWFGVDPFIKELTRLQLDYVVEIKSNLNVRVPCSELKLTETGKVCKNQIDLVKLPEYYKKISDNQTCGFASNNTEGKKEKALYHTKISNLRLNAITGKHRVVESYEPIHQTTKYLLTNQLTWEAAKILSVYSYRWVIEEFFRNAKQLIDMEGATIRSEQGITISLSLVSWIDSLLHLENWKRCTAERLPKEPLSVPSIVRRVQYENMVAFIEKVEDKDYLRKWFTVEKKRMDRKRKRYYPLVKLDDSADHAAHGTG